MLSKIPSKHSETKQGVVAILSFFDLLVQHTYNPVHFNVLIILVITMISPQCEQTNCLFQTWMKSADFACCNTQISNTHSKCWNPSSLHKWGLLYDRSLQNCRAAWVTTADEQSQVFHCMFHFVSSRALRDVRSLCLTALQYGGWRAQSICASSLLPAILTHPWDSKERGSTRCDPYSLAAKRARGGEGGAVGGLQAVERGDIYSYMFLSVQCIATN